LWARVDLRAVSKRPRGCDQAVRILVDLRDLDACGGRGEFPNRIEMLRQAPAWEPTFVRRLEQKGL